MERQWPLYGGDVDGGGGGFRPRPKERASIGYSKDQNSEERDREREIEREIFADKQTIGVRIKLFWLKVLRYCWPPRMSASAVWTAILAIAWGPAVWVAVRPVIALLRRLLRHNLGDNGPLPEPSSCRVSRLPSASAGAHHKRPHRRAQPRIALGGTGVQ